MTIELLFSRLLSSYGPQGWWPLLSLRGRDGRDGLGYLRASYNTPGPEASFEIAVGAVLTQNTAWKNAELAIRNLLDSEALSVSSIRSLEESRLSELVRPAGFYNMKARKLKSLSVFFASLESPGKLLRVPERPELLDVWGVGRETADSILLYGFGVPTFVVDAYSRRLLGRLGLLPADLSYEAIRDALEKSLPREAWVFNEFHALIVEHAKRQCRSTPLCASCFLRTVCEHASGA